MIRQLPLSPPPVHRETVGSFLGRLADANRLRPRTLPTLLGISTLSRHADPKRPWPPGALAMLADLTGYTAETLRTALPALDASRASTRTPQDGASRIRPACCTCMDARGITSIVIQHTTDHEDICLRHRRWLAPPEQYSLDQLPDVLAANRRHRRLARRAGHPLAAVHRAARTAATEWFNAADHPELLERWIGRLGALPEDPLGHRDHLSAQRIALAIYPEAVTLTAIYAARHEHNRNTWTPQRLRQLGLRTPPPEIRIRATGDDPAQAGSELLPRANR